jgi:hypothetical protein
MGSNEKAFNCFWQRTQEQRIRSIQWLSDPRVKMMPPVLRGTMGLGQDAQSAPGSWSFAQYLFPAPPIACVCDEKCGKAQSKFYQNGHCFLLAFKINQ